jgi:ATP-binding cassette, subfamily B (MDR/TAP), member 1
VQGRKTLTRCSLSEANAAANRIISIRPTKAELADKRKEVPPGEGAVGIEFKNVDFTYPDRNVKVLNKLNIKIEPGQFAALVGASGKQRMQ